MDYTRNLHETLKNANPTGETPKPSLYSENKFNKHKSTNEYKKHKMKEKTNLLFLRIYLQFLPFTSILTKINNHYIEHTGTMKTQRPILSSNSACNSKTY